MVKATSYLVAALATTVSGAAVTPQYEYVHPTGDAEFNPSPSPSTESESGFIGSNAVTVADYPFAIAGLREGSPRPHGQTCTGSVIAPRKILIAGHCADAEGTKTFAYGYDDLGAATNITKIEVVSYKQHPKYGNSIYDGYDVAVVTTKEDIPVLGGKYGRVATSADKGLVVGGKAAFALGYGLKDVGDKQKNVELHRGELPIVDTKTCDGNLDEKTMICSGTSNGRPVTVLPGDSGGPLIVDGIIVGVASWSRSSFDWYSIYGRLDNDMGDWVAEELKK